MGGHTKIFDKLLNHLPPSRNIRQNLLSTLTGIVPCRSCVQIYNPSCGVWYVVEYVCVLGFVYTHCLQLMYTLSTIMKFEYRGWIIELFLVGIHYPNYLIKNPCEARAVWEVWINGSKNSGTQTGDREKILEDWKRHIDWRISDPEMRNIF